MLRAPWKLDSGKIIELITPQELDTLPLGTILIDIFENTAVVGRDKIDRDTRFGMLAYGLPREGDSQDMGAYNKEI